MNETSEENETSANRESKKIMTGLVACEDIRFSSLFANGDVSRRETTFLLAKCPRRRRARSNGCFRRLYWQYSIVKILQTVNLLPWSCTASGENTADQCSETTLVLCIISRPLCLFNGDIEKFSDIYLRVPFVWKPRISLSA